MKTYSWSAKVFPEKCGYYWFEGVIYYENDVMVGTRHVKALVKVDTFTMTVNFQGEIHLAINCHGDFTGPLPDPPWEKQESQQE